MTVACIFETDGGQGFSSVAKTRPQPTAVQLPALQLVRCARERERERELRSASGTDDKLWLRQNS